MIRVLIAILLLLPFAASAEVALFGEPVQGGLLQGRAAPGSVVALDGKPVSVAPDGLFVIGFGRDAKSDAVLTVRAPDGRVETRALAVKQREYRVSRVDGLPDRTVTPKPEDMKRIVAERDLLAAARRTVTGDAHFRDGFLWPAQGRISGVYGSQRILNGKPRRPHFGVDIAAPSGTPVLAAGSGVVSLSHEDMFFTGKTVLIDHGLGVATVYVHLSAIEVKQGQRVRRGQRIGRIGQTGRATGPHLHWGLTWRGLQLDPALLVGPMPGAAASD